MSSTASDDGRLRLRAVLSEQFTAILVVCLLLAAAGAGLVYTTHVDPGTETETRTVSSLTVETEYVHSAEVTEPNPVFETGAVLDGRTTYFTRATPELNVEVATSYAAPAAENVTVETTSTLVIRNVGQEGTVYWRETEPLAAETVSDVSPDETVGESFSINASEIAERAASIEEQLGGSPGQTETLVTTDVVVDGTIADAPTTYSRTIDMTVTADGATYTVDDPGLQSDTTEQTEQVTVERSYGVLRSFGGPLLLIAGLAGGVGLGYARREEILTLTPAERDYLSYRDNRSEFDEWITSFRLPDSVHDRPEAEASSLRDLVDFAIDADTGVVEDPRTGAFHAVAGEFVYTYRPPEPGARDEAANVTDGDARADATDDVEVSADVESVAGESTPPDVTADDGEPFAGPADGEGDESDDTVDAGGDAA